MYVVSSFYVRNKGVYKAHGAVGWQVGWYWPFQGAIAEGVFGRVK